MFCHRCGTGMADDAGFCPSCGAPVQRSQPAPAPVYQAPPPQQVRQAPNAVQAVASAPPPYGVFTCPFCRNQAPPIIEKKVSSNGWVIFVLLLLFCLPLCWLPFVIDGCKEDIRRCSSCGAKLG
ncbi:MAG: LITAF-like zinc ribbon domain-containing protein [Candidatus Acidiferrales bacterium]